MKFFVFSLFIEPPLEKVSKNKTLFPPKKESPEEGLKPEDGDQLIIE